MIAALYVQTGGVYYGIEDVDPWDESRDARLYDGPWPVVAHPPCNRWSIMGSCRGYRDGDDGGAFEHALWCVREYGGVLEHPRYSLAWKRYGLPAPTFCGWTAALDDPGFTTEVDQHAYGLPYRKPTWLYCVGSEPPPMMWARAGRSASVASNGRDRLSIHNHYGWGNGQRSSTPPAFRDVLLDMARSALDRERAGLRVGAPDLNEGEPGGLDSAAPRPLDRERPEDIASTEVGQRA